MCWKNMIGVNLLHSLFNLICPYLFSNDFGVDVNIYCSSELMNLFNLLYVPKGKYFL